MGRVKTHFTSSQTSSSPFFPSHKASFKERAKLTVDFQSTLVYNLFSTLTTGLRRQKEISPPAPCQVGRLLPEVSRRRDLLLRQQNKVIILFALIFASVREEKCLIKRAVNVKGGDDMARHRRLVALKNLKIQIDELEIDTEEKQSLLRLINKATEQVIKGLAIENFWTKIDFVKKLLQRIKKVN